MKTALMVGGKVVFSMVVGYLVWVDIASFGVHSICQYDLRPTNLVLSRPFVGYAVGFPLKYGCALDSLSQVKAIIDFIVLFFIVYGIMELFIRLFRNFIKQNSK